MGHRLRDGVEGRYSGFLCVDVDTKPERPEQPNTTFRGLAKRDLANLPHGHRHFGEAKSGRALQGAGEWWPDLSGIQPEPGRPGAAVGRR